MAGDDQKGGTHRSRVQTLKRVDQPNDSRPLTLVIGNRNYSTWSLRAWLFLAVHEVDFKTLRLPLDTEEFARRIGDYSPSRTVPVLLDGERRIWDSLAICEYAAESLPGIQAWPEAADARAWARSVCCEMHAGFVALRREMPMNCRARGRHVTPCEATRRDIARILEIWTEARAAHAADGPWLFGQFTIADAMFAPVAMRFLTYSVAIPAAAEAWVQTLLAHPAMVDWLNAAAAEPEVIPGDERGLSDAEAPGTNRPPG